MTKYDTHNYPRPWKNNRNPTHDRRNSRTRLLSRSRQTTRRTMGSRQPLLVRLQPILGSIILQTPHLPRKSTHITTKKFPKKNRERTKIAISNIAGYNGGGVGGRARLKKKTSPPNKKK